MPGGAGSPVETLQPQMPAVDEAISAEALSEAPAETVNLLDHYGDEIVTMLGRTGKLREFIKLCPVKDDPEKMNPTAVNRYAAKLLVKNGIELAEEHTHFIPKPNSTAKPKINSPEKATQTVKEQPKEKPQTAAPSPASPRPEKQVAAAAASLDNTSIVQQQERAVPAVAVTVEAPVPKAEPKPEMTAEPMPVATDTELAATVEQVEPAAAVNVEPEPAVIDQQQIAIELPPTSPESTARSETEVIVVPLPVTETLAYVEVIEHQIVEEQLSAADNVDAYEIETGTEAETISVIEPATATFEDVSPSAEENWQQFATTTEQAVADDSEAHLDNEPIDNEIIDATEVQQTTPETSEEATYQAFIYALQDEDIKIVSYEQTAESPESLSEMDEAADTTAAEILELAPAEQTEAPQSWAVLPRQIAERLQAVDDSEKAAILPVVVAIAQVISEIQSADTSDALDIPVSSEISQLPEEQLETLCRQLCEKLNISVEQEELQAFIDMLSRPEFRVLPAMPELVPSVDDVLHERKTDLSTFSAASDADGPLFDTHLLSSLGAVIMGAAHRPVAVLASVAA